VTRTGSFSVADIDVLLFSDTKVRKLKRADTDTAMIGYIRLVLECWRSGKRLSLEDGVPEYADVAPELIRVGLLDGDGQIPDTTWEDWYGVAYSRRIQASERQQRYRASQGSSFSDRVPRP